jgi:hypothetical protein
MSLKYTVQANRLKNDGSCYARVKRQKLVTEKRFIELLKRETALEEFDLRIALEKAQATILDRLLEGDAVQTPLGIFHLTAKGGMASKKDFFDPQENEGQYLVINYRPTSYMKKAVGDFDDLEKIKSTIPKPIIHEMVSREGEDQDGFAVGQLVSIYGEDMVFDDEQEDEGVYFVAEDGSRSKVTWPLKESSKAIHLKVPELEPGAYEVVVLTRMNTSEIRSSEDHPTVVIY